MKRLLFAILLACAPALPGKAADLENTLYMELKTGRVVIEMRPDLAPNHVARIKELTREGFYDGVVFHRVIPGFMAQTGDPTGTGSGGSETFDYDVLNRLTTRNGVTIASYLTNGNLNSKKDVGGVASETKKSKHCYHAFVGASGSHDR